MIKVSGIKRLFLPLIKKNAQANRTLFSRNAIKDSFAKQEGVVKEFLLTHFEYKTRKPQNITVKQNSLNKATLYQKVFDPQTKKIKKIPTQIGIAESKNKWMTTYHFIEPETDKEIGFVTICDWQQAKKYPQIVSLCVIEGKLLKDYPKLGIKGKRITIDYLQNNMPEKYSGVGKAADQIAIEYCLRNDIKPMITSIADLNSHAAHYIRGRRFFPDKNFAIRFGTYDPNTIIKQRIKETPKGEKVNCSDLGELNMYMPQKIIQRYMRKIKNHPILH